MLVRRGLVQLLNTIRWRPEISIYPEFNHAFPTDLTEVLCFFQMELPISGSRLLVRHFQRINIGVIVWLGREDGSTTAIGTYSTLVFLPVLCLLAFLIILLLHRLLQMGTSKLNKVGHFVLDKYHKMLSKICGYSQRSRRLEALMSL